VAEQKLTDALWPDAEGDAAQRALGATVHRLRKLLAYPEAIRQSGGKLSLDEKVCWVDAFAFETRIAGNGEPSKLEFGLQLYQGSFLPGETDSPWLAPFRENLKSKFIDAVGKLGAHLEENHQFAEAMTLYSRGIEADNLVESFYQGLMRCHERLGQPSEAMSTYRRLRDLLSITLGVAPSSRSRQMAEALRTQ
jgi:DNA-binding SARP family transcriptional activator